MTMSDLFQDYSEAAGRTGAYDEMFAPGQTARKSYGQVAGALRELSLADVSARADSMARTFLDRGVTFDFAGEERPFPLDIVPRVIRRQGAAWTRAGRFGPTTWRARPRAKSAEKPVEKAEETAAVAVVETNGHAEPAK